MSDIKDSIESNIEARKEDIKEMKIQYALSSKLYDQGTGIDIRIRSKDLFINKKNGDAYIRLDEGEDTTNSRQGKNIVCYVKIKSEKRYFRESEEFYEKFAPATCVFNLETNETMIVRNDSDWFTKNKATF